MQIVDGFSIFGKELQLRCLTAGSKYVSVLYRKNAYEAAFKAALNMLVYFFFFFLNLF